MHRDFWSGNLKGGVYHEDGEDWEVNTEPILVT
jgi:hypothetical protein